MQILVDTSVWIDYFRGGGNSSGLDMLIDENIIVTNEIILAELVPFLKLKKQNKVISLLYEINRLPLQRMFPPLLLSNQVIKPKSKTCSH